MAARPPPLPAPLHPYLLVVDQPGRAVARRIAAALPGARRVLLARRAYDRARELDQDLERRRPALQVDQDRRPDHRPDLPLLLTHLRTGTLGDPGQDSRNPAEDFVDTLRDHGMHGLIDVEGVGDLRAVVRGGRQGDRGDRIAGDRHHQAVRLGHLVVAAGQRDLVTPGGDNGRLPGPSGPYVQHRRPRLGGQPAFEVAGLRKDLPDPLTRALQGACDGELAHRNPSFVGLAGPHPRSGRMGYRSGIHLDPGSSPAWPDDGGRWLPVWLPPTLSVANLQRPESQLEILTTCQPETFDPRGLTGSDSDITVAGPGPGASP